MEYSREFLSNSGVVISPKGRRRWPDDLKALIVNETLEPGATVFGVARRWGLRANRISTWRGMAKRGALVLPALSPSVGSDVEFASLVVSNVPAGSDLGSVGADEAGAVSSLEIQVGGAVLGLPLDSPANRISEIMLALGQPAKPESANK
jgi:transposase